MRWLMVPTKPKRKRGGKRFAGWPSRNNGPSKSNESNSSYCDEDMLCGPFSAWITPFHIKTVTAIVSRTTSVSFTHENPIYQVTAVSMRKRFTRQDIQIRQRRLFSFLPFSHQQVLFTFSRNSFLLPRTQHSCNRNKSDVHKWKYWETYKRRGEKMSKHAGDSDFIEYFW